MHCSCILLPCDNHKPLSLKKKQRKEEERKHFGFTLKKPWWAAQFTMHNSAHSMKEETVMCITVSFSRVAQVNKILCGTEIGDYSNRQSCISRLYKWFRCWRIAITMQRKIPCTCQPRTLIGRLELHEGCLPADNTPVLVSCSSLRRQALKLALGIYIRKRPSIWRCTKYNH